MSSNVQKDTRVLEALINGGVKADADKFLREIGSEMLQEIQLSFGAGVSSPGMPPGVDTGALRASMTLSKTGELEYAIHDQVEYGYYLEENMNRPFIQPVFNRYKITMPRRARQKGLIK